VNNHATQHLQKLLLHTASLLQAGSSGREWQASLLRCTNALVLCQVLLKYAAEHLAPERMLQLLSSPAKSDTAEALPRFAESALCFLADAAVECASCALPNSDSVLTRLPAARRT